MQWGYFEFVSGITLHTYRSPMKHLTECKREKYNLTLTTLWVNSADDKLIFFFFFPENNWHFMQIVPIEDNLQEMSKLVFWEKKKIYFMVVCWQYYPEC